MLKRSRDKLEDARQVRLGRSSLTPRLAAFRQMDVTIYVLGPAMLLLSFITQPYRQFP